MVRGPCRKFEMGRGSSRRFGTGLGTLLVVWDGSGDPQGGPGGLGVPSRGLGWVESLS